MRDMTHWYLFVGGFEGRQSWPLFARTSHVKWLIHVHMYTCSRWHDSFISVTLLIHKCDTHHFYAGHDSSTYIYIHVQDGTTHSNMWHDSFICVIWIISMQDMTLWLVRYDSFVWGTWLIHICLLALSKVGNRGPLLHTKHMTWPIYMRDMTYSCTAYCI